MITVTWAGLLDIHSFGKELWDQGCLTYGKNKRKRNSVQLFWGNSLICVFSFVNIFFGCQLFVGKDASKCFILKRSLNLFLLYWKGWERSCPFVSSLSQLVARAKVVPGQNKELRTWSESPMCVPWTQVTVVPCCLPRCPLVRSWFKK